MIALSVVAQSIIRNIEKEVVLKLKQRAAKEGVSMEEELRRILRQSVGRKPAKRKMSLLDYLCTMPNVGTDEDFKIPRSHSAGLCANPRKKSQPSPK